MVMSVTQIGVGLYHRDHLSHGRSRKIYCYEAFHWGVVALPKGSKGRDSQTFEATDSNEIDPVTLRMTNPSLEWRFKAKDNVIPTLSSKLQGVILITQLPHEMSFEELKSFFGKVPMPMKNQDPQQSCVTWVVNAVKLMQSEGWVQEFDLDQFKDYALAYADERIKGDAAQEPKYKFYVPPA